MKRINYFRITGVLLLAIMLNSCSNRSMQDQDEKLNFVMIFTDEMEPGYLQCYNSDSPYPTPNITKLAEAGTMFTNAYASSPMCTPSRFSVLTGKYPGKCTGESFREENPYDQPYNIAWNTRINESMPTIADFISSEGYVSGMAGKWHVGKENLSDVDVPEFDPDADPSDPDVNEKLKQNHQIHRELVTKTAGFDYANSVLWGNFDGFPVRKLQVHNIPWITRGASVFLDERAEDKKPFFLYVAPTAIHGPAHQESLDADPTFTLQGRMEDVTNYTPDREAIKTAIRDQPGDDKHKYAGLAYIDHQLGLIMQRLEENKLADNTVVIFIADHNVEPGKATCYEKGNKVPLIIKWPGMPMNRISGHLVQNVDLVATISAEAGNEDISIDGVNIKSLLEKESEPVRESVYMESGYARAVRMDNYKFIAFRPLPSAIQKMKDGEIEYAPNYLDTHKQAHSQIAMQYFPHYFDQDQLYDLEKDPYELNNLAYQFEYQEILQEMKAELQDYLDKFEHPFSLERIPYMETEEYRELAENTKAIGTDFIPWLSRDHGNLKYPPAD